MQRCSIFTWVFVLLSAFAANTRAADAKTSLELVPADAQAYASVQHLGEHVDAIAASRWWATLQQSSIAKSLLPKDGEPNPTAEMARALLADPNNLELLLFARELVSEEVFAYTDRRIFDLNDLSSHTMSNMVVGYMGIGVMFSSGDADFENIENTIADMLMGPVMDNLDKVVIPNVVVGFKLKDAAGAEKLIARQLDRLRPLLKEAGLPEPSDQIAEEQVAGAKTWVWRFDGNAVPWAGMFDLHTEPPATLEAFIQHLQNLKGTVTLSIRSGYLILTLGELEAASKLGKGPLLADTADFAPLKKADPKKLTGVLYTSKLVAESMAFDATDLNRIVMSTRRTMQLIGSDEERIKTIAGGVEEITNDLASLLPKPGGRLTFAEQTAAGIEFITHDYGEILYADGSKPLSILDHVGDSPLAFWAGRTKPLEDSYRTFSKSFSRAYAMLETEMVPALPEEAHAPFAQFTNLAKPVAKKFDRVVRDLWLPALADGQTALVLDARVASPTWGPEMPPSRFPLAVPLPALVCGAKDVDQLRAGISEMRETINEAATRLHELAPDEFDEFSLEEPKSRDFPGGTVHWHTLPKEWMFDKRIAPNYGLGESTAVFSLVPLHTQSLLPAKRTTLPAPLDVRDRPLAGAMHVDIAKSVELASTWFAYAATMPRTIYETRNITDPDGNLYPTVEKRMVAQPAEAMEAAENAMRDIAQLARAVPSYTSATQVIDGKLVTRGILRITDLPVEKK